jgi:two-component system nitrogen regulation sensor histidine kinase GlnL
VGTATAQQRAGDRPERLPAVAAIQVLDALPEPVLVIDRQLTVRFVNFEAQQFLDAGEGALVGRPLAEWLSPDSPVLLLVRQVFAHGNGMSEHAVALDAPRIGRKTVAVTAAPMAEGGELAVLSIREESVARRIDNQLTHRNAARSVTAMAAMLAHEVKNPLSGIRGAAQLLELNAAESDRELTRLICEEADRIVALVDRMDAFADQSPIGRAPVNIHSVLERVRRVAENGFARHVRFVERYDPSLPPVLGNRDQLIQVFLNLVKNAAEAAPEEGGEIVLATAYQRGVSVVLPGTSEKLHLPLAVSVQDNGAGIPEDLRDHLFDPFVSTKPNGSGLGLALVAKVVGDHGGVIELDTQPRRTVFKVFLPIGRNAGGAEP